jgi:hypothetical protein
MSRTHESTPALEYDKELEAAKHSATIRRSATKARLVEISEDGMAAAFAPVRTGAAAIHRVEEDGRNGSRVAPRRTAVRSAARHREAGNRSERFSTASSCRVIRGVRGSNVGACHDDRRWLWVLLAVPASGHERRAISRCAERPSERATREPYRAGCGGDPESDRCNSSRQEDGTADASLRFAQWKNSRSSGELTMAAAERAPA